MNDVATTAKRSTVWRIARRVGIGLAALVVVVALAGTILWNWPAGFYGFSTFLGRIACGVRLESIVVNGTPVATLMSSEQENATPILFLHGYGTSKEAMFAEMRWFSKTREVIAPDLPGFGDNPLKEGEAPLTGEQFVQWIEAFRIAASLDQIDLVGESMGGALAAAYAATYPTAVGRLVLQSPAGVRPPHENAVMEAIARGENPLDIHNKADFDRVLALCFVRPPPVPAPIRKYLVAKSAQRCLRHPEILSTFGPFLVSGVEPMLSSITAPTLILYGDQDKITDCSMLEVYSKGIAGSQSLLIRGAGHVAFSDAPREVRAALIKFLDR